MALKANGGGRAPAANAAAQAAIAAQNDATIEEHRRSLAAQGQQFAHSTLCRLLPRLKLTRKKTLGDERATERVQDLRQAFRQEAARIAPENFVLLDESGVNRAMTRNHARLRFSPAQLSG